MIGCVPRYIIFCVTIICRLILLLASLMLRLGIYPPLIPRPHILHFEIPHGAAGIKRTWGSQRRDLGEFWTFKEVRK